MGATGTADEISGTPDPLNIPGYAATLGAQYSMLSPENALKWPIVQPAQNTYNFEPADQLVAFAQGHAMQIRGHNLCWHMDNPYWLYSFAQTAPPSDMAQLLQDHITTVVSRYRGEIFAWDVVNEAVSDSATGVGTDLRDSLWYNQPGIGLTGTGYIEQAFRWAHAADPDALLFYNDYGLEDAGPKFEAVYNMVQDFVSRGVPIDGVGLQMHIDTTGYPSTAGLTQNIQRLAALGVQVHITEMDVKLPVDANGNASPADLQAQAETYRRILTVCLESPDCKAFQTWGFSDAYSWIPDFYPGFGAALPFDGDYQPKPAFDAMMTALRTVTPTLGSHSLRNGASYQADAVTHGLVLNQDDSPNSAQNPALRGAIVQVPATCGKAITGNPPVTATIGGVPASVVWAGPAPGRIQGFMQVGLVVPGGIAPGAQPVVIYAGGVTVQCGVTVAVN
jgi:endo-1,4-beta-xylanase